MCKKIRRNERRETPAPEYELGLLSLCGRNRCRCLWSSRGCWRYCRCRGRRRTRFIQRTFVTGGFQVGSHFPADRFTMRSPCCGPCDRRLFANDRVPNFATLRLNRLDPDGSGFTRAQTRVFGFVFNYDRWRCGDRCGCSYRFGSRRRR